MRAGRQAGMWGAATQAAHARGEYGGRARLKVGDSGTLGAHLKHFTHPLDARRVEAQRLIEHPRPLSSQTKGMTMQDEVCGLVDRRVWGGGPSGTCARGESD